MSPRWGFKTFGNPVCYTHCAPLEREQSTYRYYRHTAPLERRHCYKHDAPLGLKKLTQTFIMHIPFRCGFKTFGNPVCYKHDAPLGLKKLTQTFIMHIRPAAALRLLGIACAINMTPRWG